MKTRDANELTNYYKSRVANLAIFVVIALIAIIGINIFITQAGLYAVVAFVNPVYAAVQ